MGLQIPRLHKEERNNILLFLMCMFVYVMTGFAKSNYAATIAYIVKEGIFTKPQSGLIASAFYIFYGVGQVLGGRWVDKFSPYKCIGIGVLGAMLSNAILAFTKNYVVVLIVWSINGFMQFGIWPGLSKILATDIFPEFRQKAGFHISYGLTVGNIFSYLCAAVLLDIFGWSVMFGSSALMLLISAFLWFFASRIASKSENVAPKPIVEKTEKQTEKTSGQTGQSLWSVFGKSGFFITLPIALFACMLSTGTQVWIPTMIMESYDISQAWANVQSIILSVVCIVALWIFVPLLRKMKNEVTARLFFYSLALIPLVALQFVGKIPMWVAVVMLSLFQMTGSFAGAYSVSMFGRFAPYGYSGTAAGVSNAMSSFGVVIASTGYGVVAEYFGWSGVTAIWLVLTALISVGYCVTNIFWKRFFGIGKGK